MRRAKDGVGMGKALRGPLYRRWWRKESRKSWEYVTQGDPVLTHARGHVHVDRRPPLFGRRTNTELCRVRGWDNNLPSRLLGALPKRS
jgi:hypothetical protein